MKSTSHALGLAIFTASIFTTALPAHAKSVTTDTPIAISTLTLEELNEKVVLQDIKIRELQSNQQATAEALEQGSTVGLQFSEWANKTTLGGYGEHHFTNKQGSKGDQLDAHRFVLFVSHQFSNTVRLFSEVEIEHGFVFDSDTDGSSTDEAPGEVELEQAYIEWDFAKNHSVQIGQFLIPVGIINETHEPNTFYGTERNNVEKEVIPATWWEAGVMLSGELAPGFSYNAAVHSGLKTTNHRIRSGRQKNAKATADDFAFTGRLKYTGVKGLELAGTLQYQEDIAQGGFAGDTHSATLLEAHAVYNTGPFSLRALYAEWDVDGDAAKANDADSLDGFYIEPSFKVTEKLGVFARYSEWDRGDKMQAAKNDFSSVDIGFNYWIHPQVVLKADYSDVSVDLDDDSLNLGVGWSF